MDLIRTTARSEETDLLRLQRLYARYGYDKFRMSKFEDYTLYLQNKDFLKGGNIITFNGPDGRLLALKQDVTLSIVKNARDEATPCKVYYTENVYRASDDTNDIREIPQAEYQNHTAVVFQETFLFTGTVYANISYARPDATPGEVIAAAKAANAHEFIMKLPDGYNTIVGENGYNLSGGERQRVSIARAVLRNPEILILDEATSALDPETESLIQDALARLVKGRTTFAIAHRLSTLRNADRLVVIEKGRIAEIGSHRELLMKNGIYAKLVMAQRSTAKLTKN